MPKWEHCTLVAQYSKRYQDYVVERGDQMPLVGLPALLEAYGDAGWELVSLAPDDVQVGPAMFGWKVNWGAYRATFKRQAA